MPRTDTLQPNSDLVRPAAWGPVGLATAQGCLKDGSLAVPNDATYVRNSTTYEGMLLGLDDATDAAYLNNEIAIQGVRIRVRGKRGPFNSLRAYLQLGEVTDAARYDDWQMTTSFANYNGRWRSNDPTGKRWTKAAISSLGVVLVPNYDLDVYVSELEVQVQYVVAPATVVTAPTGTVGTANPTVTWTRTHEDGRAESGWQVRIFDQATYERGDFDPDKSDPIAYSGKQTGAALSWQIAQTLVNGTTYRAYVRTAVTVSGAQLWSPWAAAGSTFTVSFDAPAVPTMTVQPQPDSGRVRIDLQGRDNLLSTQEADAERVTDVETWTKVTSTMTVDRASAVADHGSWAVRLTKTTSSGDMTAGPTNLQVVAAGEQVSAHVRARCAVNARSVKLTVSAYNSSGTLIASADSGNVACSTSAWTTVKVDGYVTPALTAYVGITVTVVAAGTTGGEVHYIDSAGLYRGAVAPTWTRGGLWTRNLLLADDSDFETATGTFAAANTNTTIARSTTVGGQHGAAALRLTAGAGLSGVAARSFVYAVEPEQGYIVLGYFRAGAGTAQATVGIECYDADGNSLGILTSVAVTAGTGAWTSAVLGTTTPAGTAYVSLLVSFNGALANGSVWYVDALSIAAYDDAGFSLLWSRGQDSSVTTTFVVEASDDAGVTWEPVRFGDAIVPNTLERATLYDYEVPPNVVRRYRARTEATDPVVAAAPAKIASANTAVQYAAIPTTRWWLKSLTDPDGSLGFSQDVVSVKGSVQRSMDERVGEFVGIGASLPVHVSEAVGGQDGQLGIRVYGNDAWQLVEALLEDTAPLLLVDPIAQDQRYVKLLQRSWDEGVTGSGPVRVLTIRYRETAKP